LCPNLLVFTRAHIFLNKSARKENVYTQTKDVSKIFNVDNTYCRNAFCVVKSAMYCCAAVYVYMHSIVLENMLITYSIYTTNILG